MNGVDLRGIQSGEVFGDRSVSSGVYAIIHLCSGKSYVGSTVNFENRRRQHFNDLRRGKHPNRHLQSAWKRDGEGAFAFGVVERVAARRMIEAEQRYIDAGEWCNDQNGYNLCPVADGSAHGPESRAKISANSRGVSRGKGRALTAEHKARIGAANKGKKPPPISEETRAKFRNKRASAETRAKISAAVRGRKMPPRTVEWRARLSAAMTGKKASAETRARMSAAHSGRKMPPGSLAKTWATRRARAAGNGGVPFP